MLQLLYDGNDPEAVELLSGVQHLRLMHLHPPWASTRETAMFEFYSRQARQWGGQPGNYELMVKQGGLGGAQGTRGHYRPLPTYSGPVGDREGGCCMGATGICLCA